MDRFKEIESFVAVAMRGSLSGAAQLQGVSHLPSKAALF